MGEISNCSPTLSCVQVAARYLQPKVPGAVAANGASGSGPLTGRASLAGYSSTGWIEVQHPNHAATPLMVPSGSAGPGMHSTARGTRPRSLQPLTTPAPSSGHRQAAHQQAANQHFVTPGPPAPSTAGFSTAAKSTQAMPGTAASMQGRQQSMRTPQSLSMSAAISRPGATAERPGAFSADLMAAVTTQPRAADADMRAKLSRWRESKQQQQSARTATKPAVFKEPAPRPTLFRATAATRVNKEAPAGRKVSAGTTSVPAKAAAGDRSSSSAAAATKAMPNNAVSSPAAASAAESSTGGAAPAGSSASPSAFTATMATLQQSGSKPRGSKSSGSKAGANKPSPVPLLKLDQAGIGMGSPAGASQQQLQANCSPLGAMGSSTKIPKLNLSSLMEQQPLQHPAAQQQHFSSRGQHTPLSSRWPSSSGADVAFPDVTPRSVRDAMPSKLPRTPRMATPGAGHQQSEGHAVTTEGNDRQARQLDTTKASCEQQNSSSTAGAAKAAVPKLKLGAVLEGKASGQDAAAAGGSHSRPAAVGSCLSARVAGSTSRGIGQTTVGHTMQASSQLPSTPGGRNRGSNDGGPTAATPASTQQRGRTPRTNSSAAAKLLTPRSLSSSTAVAGAPAAAAAAPAPTAAAKRSDAERAEEVRQQLRLYRMQHLQLRHLNARMETAAKAKKEKVGWLVLQRQYAWMG